MDLQFLFLNEQQQQKLFNKLLHGCTNSDSCSHSHAYIPAFGSLTWNGHFVSALSLSNLGTLNQNRVIKENSIITSYSKCNPGCRKFE